MAKIISKIDPKSPEFQSNSNHQQTLIREVAEKQSWALAGGGAEALEKHRSRGKLPVRERIQTLIDRGTQFMELSPLAGTGLYDDAAPSGGIVTGIGLIEGREAMIVANDATVKGGTYFPITVKKHLRAQEIALENRLPCVYLVDSGGAFLPMQSEVFPDRDHFGRIFYNQARLSSERIPQIAVVLGSCTAGGAYVPAMCDESIIVRNQGTIFLGGPPLVRAATGEIVSAEDLGGGDVHARHSGVVDHLAESDEHALEICRSIFTTLRASTRNPPLTPVEAPLYSANEITGILPPDFRKPFDLREILARLIDGSDFHEFKAEYATTLITGFAKIHGHSVGILGNNGILFRESALKGAHFIEICEQRGIPLLFLQNITGFMVGRDYERGGIAKDGAKLVTAVSTATVPKFTVVVGGSFGAGNYGMCGRAFQPRFLWMWPNARISVMGGEQAAHVLSQVKVDQMEAKGETLTAKQIQAIQAPILDQYEKEGHPFTSTGRLWDDGIILPHETRDVLGRALSIASLESVSPPGFKLYRM